MVQVACFAGSTYVNGVDTKDACIADTYTSRVCTEGACTDSIYLKYAYIGVVSDGGACVQTFCIRGNNLMS